MHDALPISTCIYGDLRIGAGLSGPVGDAVVSAISRTCQVVASMPANFTRYPNSDRKVFEVVRGRRARTPADVLDLSALRTWGLLEVPGHLWRAMSRFGSWIEPMLISEWARLTRAYGERMGVEVGAGTAEAALVWTEPSRTTALSRMAAARLLADGSSVSCVWTGRSLGLRNLDVDHCLPWSALPCGDLWNLMPCHDLTNRRDKRDRLPSAAAMASARDAIVEWWEAAYLGDPALRRRFLLEASAALPSADDATAPSIYAALDWRRMRLRQDQQVPEWTPARAT